MRLYGNVNVSSLCAHLEGLDFCEELHQLAAVTRLIESSNRTQIDRRAHVQSSITALIP